MAKKVGARTSKKEKMKLCPDCEKELNYVMIMPKKKMLLKCECGKYFNKKLQGVNR